jgi:outer membrane protein assembly factor BamB
MIDFPMKNMRLLFLLSPLLLFSFSPLHSQIAQWQGPDRTGVFPDTALLRQWPEGGPSVKFAVPGLGKSFSSAVATADRIFTTGTKDSLEYLSALDLHGNLIWQKSYGHCWTKSIPEARTTPAVEDNRVYVISGLDEAVCLDTRSGDIIWKVDLHKTFDSSWDMFGVSESPLIYKNMLIATPCGKSTTVVALDKMTGKTIWKSVSLGMNRSNVSPMIIRHFDKDYVITATQTHLISVDANNGEIMWTYHYNFLDPNGDNTTIIANTPNYRDGCLWVSNGWDVKSVKLEIAPDGRSVKELFADHTFDNENHGVVLLDTLLFGSSFTGRQMGKWVCMNWNTGEILWLQEWFNKGPIIAADGMLYCYEEKQGNIALVKADPKGFNVISTLRVKHGTGPHWAHPSIYNKTLLIRHGDFLIGYDIGGTI